MTDKPITRERLLHILDSQAQKTAQAIAGLDEATLDLPARDDGWTARDILAHIASGHEGMLALAQGRVPGGLAFESFSLDEHNEAQRQLARSLTLGEVLDRLEAARGQVRAFIEQEDEARYGDVVHTPWMGGHARGQFLMYPALHEGGHRVELEAWRATLPGEAR
jgi:uncharacterized damage-inducible protein DinB